MRVFLLLASLNNFLETMNIFNASEKEIKLTNFVCVCVRVCVHACVFHSLNFFPNPKDGTVYALGKNDHLEVSKHCTCASLLKYVCMRNTWSIFYIRIIYLNFMKCVCQV